MPEELTKLELAFAHFHHKNPHVYRILVRDARAWRAKHPGSPCGIAMLYERARWEVMMGTDTQDGFKLNNNHRAYYARLIMEEEPDLEGIFNLRRAGEEDS